MTKKLLLMDGSMSCQLSSFGYNAEANKPHWTFPANSDLTLMKNVYEYYLSLDVNIITTNTYHFGSTMDQTLIRSEKERDRHVRHFEETCLLLESLVNGRDSTDCHIWGSVGTLATMYHDQSEYSGVYMETIDSKKTAERYYFEILYLFMEKTKIRTVIFETISSEKEAHAALNALIQFPSLKAVVSFTFREDGRLRHGESINEIAEKLSSCCQVLGVGMNCTDPINILPGLQELEKYRFRQIIICPNSGDNSFLSNEDGKKSGISESLVLEWAMHGATVIGGCCGIDNQQYESLKLIVDKVNFGLK